MKIQGNTVTTPLSKSIFHLPVVTDADNGKVLRVIDGAWAASELPYYGGEVADGDDELKFFIECGGETYEFPLANTTTTWNDYDDVFMGERKLMKDDPMWMCDQYGDGIDLGYFYKSYDYEIGSGEYVSPTELIIPNHTYVASS